MKKEKKIPQVIMLVMSVVFLLAFLPKIGNTTENILRPSYETSKEDKNNLVGQQLTIEQMDSPFAITNLQDQPINSKQLEELLGESFEIIEYHVEDNVDIYVIQNAHGTFKLIDSPMVNWYLNAYVDDVESKVLGKTYIPFHKGLMIEGLDFKPYRLDASKVMKVEKVAFRVINSKESGVVISFDNGLEVVHQATSQYINDERFLSVNARNTEFLFVDLEAAKSAPERQSKEIENMREKTVTIGMTKEECQLSWGKPEKESTKDGLQVLIYQGDYGDCKLLFKGEKLVAIE